MSLLSNQTTSTYSAALIRLKNDLQRTSINDIRPHLQTQTAALSRPKQQVRVLHVFSVLGLGGAETWLLSLLRYYRESEGSMPFSVVSDVLLTAGERGVFDDEVTALGANLFYVRFAKTNTMFFMRELRSILANHQYDAIHDHQDYIAGLHFLMAAGVLPPIRIAHVHNPLYHRINYANSATRRMAQTAGKRLLRRYATHILGTSQQILDEYGLTGAAFRGITTGPAHCGFDVRRFAVDRADARRKFLDEVRWDDRSKVILFVGRLDGAEFEHNGQTMSHKNPRFALAVARACISMDSRVRIAFAGAGEEKRRELEADAAMLGIAERVKFLGPRSDVAQLMAAADLLLFPSLAEGLGMVAVEAQAAGLPVLASACVPRECLVVKDLVEFLPLGDVEEWSRTSVTLLNRERPDTKKCNALVRDSKFSIENSAAHLAEIYKTANK